MRQMCQPCPRTGVKDVPGLYSPRTPAGDGATPFPRVALARFAASLTRGYARSSLRDEECTLAQRCGVTVLRAMTDERPMRSRQEWSKRQLRLHPELARYARDDHLAQRWCGFLRDGWWASLFTAIVYGFLWSFACLVVAAFLFGFSTRIQNEVMQIALRFLAGGIAILWIPGFWIAAQFGAFVTHRYATHVLRFELRRRGIPICVRCGYEGGDMSAPRCPECGAPSGA